MGSSSIPKADCDSKIKKHLIGHRQRLKKRFDTAGLDAFADHEVLELLLFYIIPRKDTKTIAKNLLEEFGCLQSVFNATIDQLLSIKGVKNEVARFIKLIKALFDRILQQNMLKSSIVVNSPNELISYLKHIMSNLQLEEFNVIFLNNANKIIKIEKVSSGTETQTAVFPKQIVRRALFIKATGIILVHNHPSGSIKPSSADIEITKAIYKATSTLDIRLLDHIIIGSEGKGFFSFYENGLLDKL